MRLRFAGFRMRAFVSVGLVLFFVSAGLTGAVLFVTPPGRVANWTGWRLWGLTKQEWIAVHIASTAAFLVLSVVHVVLNWRPLVGYFRSRVTRRAAVRPEWVAAAVVWAAVLAGTYWGVRPFSDLLAWNTRLKNSWAPGETGPPVAHAELMSLAEVAEAAGVEAAACVARLEAAGVKVPSVEVNFGALAAEHGMTPEALYRLAVGGQGGGGGGGRGRGPGGRGMGQGRAGEILNPKH